MAGPTTFWAPVHRLLARMAPGANGFPLNAAPSMDFLGNGIQDHRLPYNTANYPLGAGALGWYGSDPVVINQVPSTISAVNIAVGQKPVSGTAMALVSSSGAGITVVATATTIFPSLTSIAAGTLIIDSAPALNRFGTAGNFVTAFYDRRVMLGRAVSVTGVSGGTGGLITFAGYDVYGYAMTETITVPAGVATTNGKKAFKFIVSATPNFSDGSHNYSIGTADVFGFGVLALSFPNVTVNWNNAWITASTGFVGAVTTTASPTTGDVRGTYATQDASDGVKRLYVTVNPSLASLLSNPTTGLFGVAQA